MNRGTAFAAIGVALSLSACASSLPSEVNYATSKPAGAAGDRWIGYRLATSTIAIGLAAKDKSPDGAALQGVAADAIDLSQREIHWVAGQWRTKNEATADPAILVAYVAPSASDKLLFLEPNSSLIRTVNMGVTYRENSELLKEVTFNTQDHRKEIIETVGAIAVGIAKQAVALGLLGGPNNSSAAPSTMRLPIVLTLEQLEDTMTPNGLGMAVQMGRPSGAQDFKDALEKPNQRGALFTSACREATLTLLPSTDRQVAFGLRVADPSSVRSLPLPTKGKIELDPLCGGNVVIEEATRTSTKELAEAVFAQIEQLRKALKPAPSGGGGAVTQ